MSYTISITDDQVFTALTAWLTQIINGSSPVQGLVNRVSMPAGGFIQMTNSRKVRLATNEVSYDSTLLTQTNTQSMEHVIQLDCYGDSSSDWASIIGTAFRSQVACDFFSKQVAGLYPLYSEDPVQAPFIDGEEQYEQRWTILVHFQYKPAITDAQESALGAKVGLINVDAAYPA